MKPGIARALPMGIVGFVGGALLAIIIRLLQGLDPNPDQPFAYVGPALVLGTFISAGTFVWGMGGFDPRMSAHGEHDDHAHAEPETPLSILSGFTWQIASYTIILVLLIATFAFLPQGPQLRSIKDDGNPSSIHYARLGDIYKSVNEFTQKAANVPLPALPDSVANIQISYLVMFMIFVAVTLVSLFAVAGLIALVLTNLGAAAKKPDAYNIPWRVVGLVAIIGGLSQFPILAPTMDFPMALIVPAFLVPPLAFLIAAVVARWSKGWIILFALLTFGALNMPVLVPTVKGGNIHWAYNLLIFFIIEMIVFNGIKFLLSEAVWQRLSAIVYGFTFLALVVITLQAAAGDVWQMIFLVSVELGVFFLALPVYALKILVPAGIWNSFAAVEWDTIIPSVATAVVNWLRNGLPKVLGQ